MKKSTIFAIVLLFSGIICCGVAFGMGVGEFSLDSAPRFLKYQETAVDKGLDAHAEVDRLILDIDAAECVVQTGNENSLTAGADTTWRLEGKTLTIEQEQREGWWWKSNSAPITLTIQDDGLYYLDVDVDAGSVLVNNMTVTQDLTCDLDAGTITLKDVTVGRRLEADVDAGSIDYAGCLYGDAELNCDAGHIHLDLLSGSTIGKVTGNVDVGKIKVYVDGKKVIDRGGFAETISTDLPGAMGNKLLTFDCDAGSISVEITQTEE